MAEIDVGIIGPGRMGWLHAEHLRGAVRGARLVAAAVDPEHRQRLEASGAAPCPLAIDVEALIADPAVDAVVVASSSNVHHEHIELAAKAGKAIFAEKPLADSVAKARGAVAAVERAGVPFQIGFQRRFDPGYAKAKDLIAAGAIGEVELFRGISCDRDRPRGHPPVDFLRTSGGLFWDLAIHDFDAARFLVGDEIAAVHATGAIMVEPALAEFDDVDYGIVTLRFRGGALGVVQCSWRAPYGYDIRAEVYGARGKVITEVDAKTPTWLYTAHGFEADRHDQFVERFRDAYRLELQAFVDAVQSGASPQPDANDGLRAILVSDAATRSRREGRWITVDE